MSAVEELDCKYLVVAGTPCNGFQHYGPFNTALLAADWGERNVVNGEFWVAPLVLPLDDAPLHAPCTTLPPAEVHPNVVSFPKRGEQDGT